jgi:hypothetical protein
MPLSGVDVDASRNSEYENGIGSYDMPPYDSTTWQGRVLGGCWLSAPKATAGRHVQGFGNGRIDISRFSQHHDLRAYG